MHKLLTGMVLLLAMGVLSGAPDHTDELKKADQDWAAATEARDLEKFMAFIGDDAYMCGLDGKWMHGKDAIREDWRQAFADKTFKLTWFVESADISRDGNMGYTRGTFQGSQGGRLFTGSYATVWQKAQDGQWRTQVDIATAVP